MMFTTRFAGKELLDADHIPFADIKQNMRELNVINTYLGGHAITVAGFNTLVNAHKNLSVCEVGCGGGDNLVAIAKAAQKKKINISLSGIDIKRECIEVAKKNRALSDVDFIISDYQSVSFTSKPDILFSSLFCHHFTKDELVKQFIWMKENCRIGFFVNDLHRHPVAYYTIKVLTRLFSSSYLVKHDAPVSVLRGFSKDELLSICKDAGLHHVRVDWRWAFRYLIVYRHV